MSFQLLELRLTGRNVTPASVKFTTGLNVITGPSNTGKSYIFQCLNYMFGSIKVPKGIDQSTGYTSCYLSLQSHDGKVYTLKTDLKAGAFQLYELGLDAITVGSPHALLGRRHDEKSPDNVSQFFLGLCNLSEKKLKVNEKGKKRGLSFRDLARLSVVDEVRILTDASPLFSGQHTSQTVEISAFKLLLTGLDDSDIIEKLAAKEIVHRKGKLELLIDLIGGIDNELRSNDVVLEKDQLTRISNSEVLINEELQRLNVLNTELVNQRSVREYDKSNSIQQHSDLAIVYQRSQILAQQYDSDVERLVSTIEACELFKGEDTDNKECPVCHTPLHSALENNDIDTILHSCGQELSKVNLLKTELISSQQVMVRELEYLGGQIRSAEQDMVAINLQIENRVKNAVTNSVQQLTSLQE